MEFEDLQAIWDTQNERPAFSMNDSRLAVGLYQQRDQSRRRLFRKEFAPMYVTGLFLGGVSLFLFVVFLVKTVSKMRLTDPQMNIWDGAALLGVVVGAAALVASMYAQRRKHERAQNMFAPSLREELERGISQLDFELNLHSARRVRKVMAFLAIAVTVTLWETARLNGESTPWLMLAVGLGCTVPGSWLGAAAEKKFVERVMPRKRALESMLAGIVEDTGRR
jgi:hypothetical protein